MKKIWDILKAVVGISGGHGLPHIKDCPPPPGPLADKECYENGTWSRSECIDKAEIFTTSDPCYGLCFACAYKKIKAENESLKKKYQEFAAGKAKYYHDIWCSANRDLPMGCDVCSCTTGVELKRLRGEYERLFKKKKQLEERYRDHERLWEIADGDNCEGSCDLASPYEKCPECAAGSLLNELGEIMGAGLRDIERALKGGG